MEGKKGRSRIICKISIFLSHKNNIFIFLRVDTRTHLVLTSGSGHVHGIREISPVDAGVGCLLLEYLISLISTET